MIRHFNIKHTLMNDIPTKLVNSRTGTIWLLSCVACGIFVTFAMIHYSYYDGDETYQSLCVRMYEKAPMGLLVFYLGNVWTEIFGFTVINLKILVSIEILLAVGLTSYYLYRLTRNKILTGLAFLLACILMKLFAFSLYGWDSGTYLFDAIAICLMVSLLTRPTGIKFLVLGVDIGLMTLGRLPSGIMLPLAIVVFIVAAKMKEVRFNLVKASLLIFTGWCATVVALLFLILGSPAEYVNALVEGNVVTGHSPLEDGTRLFKRLAFILTRSSIVTFPGLGCLLLACVYPRFRHPRNRRLVLLCWWCFCIIFMANILDSNYSIIFMRMQTFPALHGGDFVVGFGMMLAYPIYLMFKRRKNLPSVDIKLWAIVSVMFAMAFGSDAYFQRMTVALAVPVIIGLLVRTPFTGLKNFLWDSTWICVVVLGSMLLYQFYYTARIKNRYARVQTLGPLTGLHTNVETEGAMYNLGDAVSYLQRNNVKFAPIDDNILTELIYGPNDGLSFHEFQYNLTERKGWDLYKDQIIPNVDAFVYVPDVNGRDYGPMIKDLKKAGFNDTVRIGHAVIIYRDGFRQQ